MNSFCVRLGVISNPPYRAGLLKPRDQTLLVLPALRRRQAESPILASKRVLDHTGDLNLPTLLVRAHENRGGAPRLRQSPGVSGGRRRRGLVGAPRGGCAGAIFVS